MKLCSPLADMSNHAVVKNNLLPLLLLLQMLYFVPPSTSNRMIIPTMSPCSGICKSGSGSSTIDKTQSELAAAPDRVPFVLAPNVGHTPPLTADTDGPKGELGTPALLQVQDPGLDTDIDVVLDTMASTPIRSSQSKLELEESNRICVYKIDVKTGTQWGAGTDSTISMQLTSISSQDNQQVSFALPDNDNDSDKFEAGNHDSFQVNTKCVTNICRMTLYTDHTGFFAGWYVETVSVSITGGAPAESHNWILNQWLPATDGSLSVVKDDCF